MGIVTEGNGHRLLAAVGVCLLVIGTVFLPGVLATPPTLYTYSAEQIHEDDELSPSTLYATVDRKSTVVSAENISERERVALRAATSNGENWTRRDGNASNAFDYRYVVYDDELYEVETKDEPPAIRVVDLERRDKLTVLSIDTRELPSQNYFGVRKTDTQREVVRHTIDRKRYGSLTRANVNNTIIDDEGDFYRITYESARNSGGFMIWSLSVVFLSLSLFLGAISIVYVCFRRFSRSSTEASADNR